MINRKLKLEKGFKPLPVDEGDEHFANGIFDFNVTKMLAFIASHPEKFSVEQFDLSTLADYGTGDRLDQETIRSANLSNPIILAEISPGRFNVIDGNHRVERARRDGLKMIPARRICADQHFVFLTSAKAYEAYVRYWNDKVEQLNEK